MRLLTAILLFALAAHAAAQDDSVPALNAAGTAAMEAGRHDEAAEHFGRALQAMEAYGGYSHAAMIIVGDNRAVALFAAGRAAEGAAAFAALNARRDAMDEADPAGHARYIQNRANDYRALNRNAEAAALLARLAALQRDHLPEQRNEAADTLAMAAFLADAAGNYAYAVELYRALVSLRTELHGPEHPQSLADRGNLGLALHRAGENAEARAVLENLLPALADDEVRESFMLTSLAAIARTDERHEEAESLYRRALEIRENGHAPEQLAAALNNLATALYDQHRALEAEPLHRRALTIYENILAENHPALALARINLAAALDDLGRTEEAEVLYRAGLAAQEAAFGPDHPALSPTLGNLGMLRAAAGDAAEAAALFARVTQIRRAHYPPGEVSRAAAETVQARHMLASSGDIGAALALSRAATDGLIERTALQDGPARTRGMGRFARHFEVRVDALWAAAQAAD